MSMRSGWLRIKFKNGDTIDVSQDVANLIGKRMMEGAKPFQVFFDENNKTFLIINLGEIVYIQ